ncbi:MAG TPA: tyrosine-type recombinase/integrase [Blastocatellia bacterium]|nr:tyrosine-type recombinase/integrase [Blastocatellia bacterium]
MAGYDLEPIVIRWIKRSKRFNPVTEDEIKRILRYRPSVFLQKRLRVLILTLVDTGARINEILTLERNKIDFDSLVMKLKGKGNKERVVPFFPQLRAELLVFLRLHPHSLVFYTSVGTKINYGNFSLSFQKLCERLGIEFKPFHALRRAFAKDYLKSGGT